MSPDIHLCASASILTISVIFLLDCGTIPSV